jgi:hypothetical protein
VYDTDPLANPGGNGGGSGGERVQSSTPYCDVKGWSFVDRFIVSRRLISVRCARSQRTSRF